MLANPPEGCRLVPKLAHEDVRGTLVRTEKEDNHVKWKEILFVANKPRVLRGLHCAPCKKSVSVVRGAVWDCLVDLRSTSATYGKWWAVELAADRDATLLVAAGVAHGYYSDGPSDMVYGIEEAYDPTAEVRVRWNDPTLAIAWPFLTEQKHDIVLSDADQHNPLWVGTTSAKEKQSVLLVYGDKGYLGSHIVQYFSAVDLRYQVVLGVARLENRKDVLAELTKWRPDNVLCCVGVGGVPSATWHDEHEAISTRGNILYPALLVETCDELKMHCTVLGSGVVQSCVDRPIAEGDPLQPCESAYGHIRATLEEVLKPFLQTNCLLLRIMYPVVGLHDARCLLSKLQKCKVVHNVPSSITVLPTLLPHLSMLLQHHVIGIVNFVNSGTVSPADIVDILQVQGTQITGIKLQAVAAAWLDNKRLSELTQPLRVTHCRQALLDVLRQP